MPLELGMDLRRQMMLHEVGQETHEIGAAALHCVMGSMPGPG